MKLSEYDDETLLEEVKKRGFKIEVPIEYHYHDSGDGEGFQTQAFVKAIKIGGVRFDITN